MRAVLAALGTAVALLAMLWAGGMGLVSRHPRTLSFGVAATAVALSGLYDFTWSFPPLLLLGALAAVAARGALMSESPRAIVTEVSRLELFFDLVFVFTITQFTTVLEQRASLEGVAQAAVMLAIVWWMYGGYAWLTNLAPPDRAARRAAMVAGMISYLVLALAIPDAFEGNGLEFGLAYLLVVLVHGGLFTVSTELRLSTIYRGFFPVNVGFALLVVAGGAWAAAGSTRCGRWRRSAPGHRRG